MTARESTCSRLVRRGSLRFVKRPYPTDTDGERLLVVGDHWESGTEVVLRVFDADESDYYPPGPVNENAHWPEWQVAESAGAFIYEAEKRVDDEDNAYLQALPLAELEAEHERRRDPDVWNFETERKRKRSAKVLPLRRQAALDAAWAELQARIPCGVTILVPAKPRIPRTDSWSIRQFGTHEAGSPAYLVHVVRPSWSPAETPIEKREYETLSDETQGTTHSSAEVLAERIARGYTTTAYPSIELRRKFYQRVGSGIIDAPRVTIGGKTYYIGKPRFTSEVLVLDGETMTLCRSKKTRQLIEAAHQWQTGRGHVVDAIAYREALPDSDAKRAELPKLHAQLAAGDAAKPAHLAVVDYQLPKIPEQTVAEVLAMRKDEE